MKKVDLEMGFEILVRLVLVDSRNLGKGNKIQLDKWGNEYGLLLFSCSVVSNSLRSGVALMIKGINISYHNAWHNLSALSI